MKVIYKAKMAGYLIVDVEGYGHPVGRGTRVVDENGNQATIESIAMTHYTNPEDRKKQTTLVFPSDVNIGNVLSVME